MLIAEAIQQKLFSSQNNTDEVLGEGTTNALIMVDSSAAITRPNI